MKEKSSEELFNDVVKLAHEIDGKQEESEDYTFLIFADKKEGETGCLTAGISGVRKNIFSLLCVLFRNDRDLCEIAFKAAIDAKLRNRIKDNKFVNDILKRI